MSDFETIGRDGAVKQAVERFYERVFADERLAPYFSGSDETRLKQHQAMLVAQVLGGPARYTGRTLDEAHAGLGVTDDDFGRVVGHFADALRDLDVDEAIVGRAGAALAGTRDQIVEASADTSKGPA